MSDNKLRSILMDVSTNTIWGLAIHEALNTQSDLSCLVLEIQEAYVSYPEEIGKVLGPEALALISKPFKKVIYNVSHQLYPHQESKGLPLY